MVIRHIHIVIAAMANPSAVARKRHLEHVWCSLKNQDSKWLVINVNHLLVEIRQASPFNLPDASLSAMGPPTNGERHLAVEQ